VSGKNKRLTFYEVPNDLNSMVDIGKIADLILLVVDANFGFEMETFEFLNILQQHGFPKIMGVLTHLDLFKKKKGLNNTKKTMKKRFWAELYKGAKLFYLSSLMHGKYLKRDITNLARYISLQKYRPLIWRNTHSYVLVDRFEDITDPEIIRKNKKIDRNVLLYGYVRGTNMKKQQIHIPGCGDFSIKSISKIEDPCPHPVKRREKQKLNEKEKLLYAPMSNVGQIIYDKDAIYFDMPVKKKKRKAWR